MLLNYRFISTFFLFLFQLKDSRVLYSYLNVNGALSKE
jgi:hypothetical protein